MRKQLYKIIILIFSISLSLGTSVNYTGAFLDGDLGLNLYKDLDKGLEDFEEKMYVYELNGQNKKDISENINKILQKNGIGECLIAGITPEIINGISNGEIEIINKNLKDECKGENGELNSKQLGNIIIEVGKIKTYYKNKSDKKAKRIHEISKIGMYSDGNPDNSPFDIIKDIQDIDKIIFTEKIEYNGEEVDFLEKYRDNPFVSPFFNNLDDIISENGEVNNLNSNIGNNIINGGHIENNNSNGNNNNQGNLNTLDGNDFVCKTENDESGLNSDSLNILLGSLNGNNDNPNSFLYGNNGHIKLPGGNSINTPNLNSNDFSSQLLLQGISPYSAINDNPVWGCNNFFCITVEFIVKKQNALGYGESKSIENILKTSNKHLKKAMNTSLVQSKMTTNNFEMSLRDLDLPNMFHMGYVITKKAPPILNLENLPGDSKAKEFTNQKSKQEIQDMLYKKYSSLGLDYKDQNSINNLKQASKEIKTIVNSLANPTKRAGKLTNEYNKIRELRNKTLEYQKIEISGKITNDILKDFDKQFTEIENFNKNIMDYVNGLDIMIKNLKRIKTYSG